MTTFIGGLDVDRVYTADEIGMLILSGKIKNVTMQGYVAQANSDGTCRFVPYHKSSISRQRALELNRARGIEAPRVFEAQFDMQAELEKDLPKITKRTPQQRVDSLAQRIQPDATVLGADPTEGEAARRIAAGLLAEAEKKNEPNADTRLRANRKERRRQAKLERLERKGLI